MPLKPPQPQEISPSRELLPLLKGDWMKISDRVPSIEKKILKEKVKRIDSWLMDAWVIESTKLATHIGAKVKDSGAWNEGVKSLAELPAHDKVMQLSLSKESIQPDSLERKFAENFMLEYLNPLICPPGREQLLAAFYQSLVDSDSFITGLEIMFREIPDPVKRMESERDLAMLMQATGRWNGSSPQALRSVLSSGPESRYVPETDGEPHSRNLKHKNLKELNRDAGKSALVGVPIGPNTIAPANLFVSVASATIMPYLNLLEIIFENVKVDRMLKGMLLSLSYGLVARALMPLAKFWDFIDGTAVTTVLLPAHKKGLGTSIVFLQAQFSSSMIEGKLKRKLVAHEVKLLVSFRSLWMNVFNRESSIVAEMIVMIEMSSGGRVILPRQFTDGNGWSISIRRETINELGETVSEIQEANVKERLFYSGQGPSRSDASIYWILSSAWRQTLTSVALMNQSGVGCFITAANNRWGGRHLPHVSHRNGVSIDLDSGIDVSSNPGDGPKIIKDPKQRDKSGAPVKNAQNMKRPDCLKKIDRLAAWITVQAFVVTGVTQFLYGDDGIVYESIRHLQAHFKSSKKPESSKRQIISGDDRYPTPNNIYDPHIHYNHFHFEIAREPFGVEHYYSPNEGYLWMLETDDLFTDLYKLALIRDDDKKFWLHMAGLADIPRRLNDFETLREEARKQRLIPASTTDEDLSTWKAWWSRGRKLDDGSIAAFYQSPGLPLLPIWHPDLAGTVRTFDTCPKDSADFAFA